jgi:short-subunit dehydrogenase
LIKFKPLAIKVNAASITLYEAHMTKKSKTIIITGSTRGIGFGLADVFLKLGCNVAVSGRSREAVEKAVHQLSQKYGSDRLAGFPCDVAVFDQVQALWTSAKKQFGEIDIWINNAGIGHDQVNIWEIDPGRIRQLVETNIIGTVHGAKVAITGMLTQKHGAIYNLEGFGSDGMIMPGISLYGTSKYGIRYLTDALVKETRGTGLIIGAIRPGMVATDLITKPYEGKPDEWKRVVKLFNIISDTVETVTPWMAKKVLANKKTGARFNWFHPLRAFWRFSTAWCIKRNIFPSAAPQ